MDKLKIVHISDLHFGSGFWPGSHQPNLADSLAEHIAHQEPNLILCTGDVVNGALAPKGYEYARRFFDRMRAQCKDVPVKFVPGNHDYAIWGIWGIKKFLRSRFNEFAGDGLLRANEPIFWGMLPYLALIPIPMSQDLVAK